MRQSEMNFTSVATKPVCLMGTACGALFEALPECQIV